MSSTPVLAVIVVLALALVAVASGRALAAAVAGPAAANRGGGWALAADGLGGLALLHLAMLGLDAAGVAWTRATLAAWLLVPAASLAVLGGRRRWSRAGRSRAAGLSGGADGAATGETARGEPKRGPGTVAALAAAGIVALYAGVAWTRWIATSDFVYHWGVKGLRYHLARGVDWAFLADPLHLAQHADYPNLLPDLYAAAALLNGGWDERAQMLWSALFLAALPAAAGETWRRLGIDPAAQRIGVVAVTAVAAMFGIGYRLAGGGEMAIAAALAVAAPVLVAPARGPGAAADALRLGFAAALAAGAKLEGLPLAAILIGLWLVRGLRDRLEGGWEGLGRKGLAGLLGPLAAAALPAALVIAPWLWGVQRHGLLSPNHPGGFDPARVAAVMGAVAEGLGTREWHGFGWLAVALIPVLLAARRGRWIGLACALQLAFYLWVYLASSFEPRFYVLSSLPRLLFHLVPATLIGAVAVLGQPPSGKLSVSAKPQMFGGSLT